MRIVIVLLALLVFVSCGDDPVVGPTDSPDVNVITTVIVNTPSPGASPSTSPGGTCPSIPRMRVGIFGYRGSCPNPPNNSSGVLPLDCSADLTATPFGVNGEPVSEMIHGFNLVWTVSNGIGRIDLNEAGDNVFNRVIFPRNVGDVSITAVLTPPGCSSSVTGTLNLRVVASGSRS